MRRASDAGASADAEDAVAEIGGVAGGSDAESLRAVAVRVIDRLCTRLNNAGAHVEIRHATGLSLDAAGAAVIWSDEGLDVALAAATGDVFDLPMEIKGRHECEGCHAHDGSVSIELRPTGMSSVEDIVDMIAALHGAGVGANIVKVAGAAVMAKTPALSAIVDPMDDSGAGDQPTRQHGEHVHRVLHLVAMLGVEMRLSSVTTLDQCEDAGLLEELEVAGPVDGDATKKAVLETGNKRAVIVDLLRSAGVVVSDAKIRLIEGLLANMMDDPTEMLGLASVESSGDGQCVASDGTDVQGVQLTPAQRNERL